MHVIDTATNIISYVSAGHPPALVVDESGEPTFLEGGRRAVLGIRSTIPEVAQQRFPAGSVLVAYTDGLVEQARDFDRGLQLLSDSVQSARGRSARDISDTLATTISINAPDDIAYTVICRVGSVPGTALLA